MVPLVYSGETDRENLNRQWDLDPRLSQPSAPGCLFVDLTLDLMGGEATSSLPVGEVLLAPPFRPSCQPWPAPIAAHSGFFPSASVA